MNYQICFQEKITDTSLKVALSYSQDITWTNITIFLSAELAQRMVKVK